MNSDHRENIGTHPAFSDDPETALRARLDAATRKRAEAETNYTTARNNLRVFLDTQRRIANDEPTTGPIRVSKDWPARPAGAWPSQEAGL